MINLLSKMIFDHKVIKNKIRKILIIIMILIIISGFMCILRYSDDTTVSLAMKFNPFSENIVTNYDSSESTKYFILYSDENELIGESIPKFILNFNIYILLLVFLIANIFYFKAKK